MNHLALRSLPGCTFSTRTREHSIFAHLNDEATSLGNALTIFAWSRAIAALPVSPFTFSRFIAAIFFGDSDRHHNSTHRRPHTRLKRLNIGGGGHLIAYDDTAQHLDGICSLPRHNSARHCKDATFHLGNSVIQCTTFALSLH